MTGAMAGHGGLDRRRAERVPIPATGGPVSVVGARLVDVSPFGMMIESPVAMSEDAVLEFRLVVDGQKVDVSARVANCRLVAERRHGVGLEFVSLTPEWRDRLRAVLARTAGERGH